MNTDPEQQQPPPETLYKYRDWTSEFSKKSIKDLEVFFPSPRRFNDPFDCAIPFDPFTSNEAAIKTIAARAVDRDTPELHSIDRRFEIESRLENWRKNSRSSEARQKWFDDTREDMANRYGVLSLTEDSASILMWSYYADKHAGFCVGYDALALLKAVYKFHSVCNLFPVRYQREYPNLELTGLDSDVFVLDKTLTTKAKDWEHEREYRLILSGKNEIAIPLPNSVIVEVIVGARMPQKQIDEVVDILEGHDLSATLRQAKLKEDEYAITIEQFPSE